MVRYNRIGANPIGITFKKDQNENWDMLEADLEKLNAPVTSEKIAENAVQTGNISDKTITSAKIEDRTVGIQHFAMPVAYVEPSKNLIDKDKLLIGYYIGSGTGNENPNPNYNATGFIAIKPNTIYTLTPADQLAFSDKNKKYISGITGVAATKTFTSPSNANFIRVTVLKGNESKVQLEEGSYATRFESFKSPTSIKSVLQNDKITDLLYHIMNPFTKTQLKLVGDSITAGVGGTGYSPTGELMFIDSTGKEQRANVETATCWGNSLKKYLEEKFNKEFMIDLSHPEIKLGSYDGSFIQYDSSDGTGYQYQFPNKQAGCTMLEFTFYGESFSILISKAASRGVFDVYVDGQRVAAVDTYDSGFTQFTPVDITGLSKSYHKVKFVETATKNMLSSGTGVYIQGLKIPKTTVVKNWGISGRQSRHLTYDGSKWVETEDDFVLLQLGTNDRQRNPHGYTQEHQRRFINYARGLGKKVIMMASIPATTASETSYPYAWHMEDINNKLVSLAHEMQVPFINNYHFMVDYLMYTGKDLNSLLADGLHPNDVGYELIFKNILKHLGFGFRVW
ncbi:GDSL-type esterase/lipase family protein [Bacillus cereus group sp. MYBK35-2]|uniref:GDSL-type esterase/lipase family protein n=1 Tax=unclassified Bacillus cereus group TaxID=2750818 RepID=UPI0029F09A51|nr:GDSL-type esterase/lipase family protein [Bacillus cereus]MDA2314623.1 GDSL-type esterase/lipase family protein [Bacillus cereus]MDA2499385.1 GDSL-type esterase/lipase family protein [Bacillus cereus]